MSIEIIKIPKNISAEELQTFVTTHAKEHIPLFCFSLVITLFNDFSFAAYFNKKVVGLVLARTRSNRASILVLVVCKEHRRKGIAEMLLKACINSLKEMKIYYVNLETEKNNEPSINLYKKFDFLIYGIVEHYYGENRHAYKMKLYLE